MNRFFMSTLLGAAVLLGSGLVSHASHAQDTVVAAVRDAQMSQPVYYVELNGVGNCWGKLPPAAVCERLKKLEKYVDNVKVHERTKTNNKGVQSKVKCDHTILIQLTKAAKLDNQVMNKLLAEAGLTKVSARRTSVYNPRNKAMN